MSERHYWLQREAYEGDITFPLLKRGYLCYGWLDFAEDEDFMKKANDGTLTFDEVNEKIFGLWNYRPRNRFCLWNFIHCMKAGDWVVVPGSGVFSIYEIEDDHIYTARDIPDEVIDALNLPVHRIEDGDLKGFFWRNSGKILDVGIIRRVRQILKESSRSDYIVGGLSSRMKYQMANISLDVYEKSILEARDHAKRNEPISLHSKLKENIPYLLNSMKEALEPGKFEKLVVWYFKKLGATDVDIPAKNKSGKVGDEDVDVTASFKPLKTTYYVQVKFHEGTTEQQALNQVAKAKETGTYSVTEDETPIYWALTSADRFSQETIDAAKDCNVRLIAGPEFMGMLLDVGIDDIDEAFKMRV